MIEKPPVLPNEPTEKACQIVFDKKYRSLIEKINTEYMYWDKVKYYTPEGVGQKDFWYAIKLSHLLLSILKYNSIFVEF